MRSTWRDGERLRVVDVTSLGGGRFRVMVDDVALDLEVQRMGDGRFRLAGEEGTALAQVTVADGKRFVRLGHLDFVLERVAGGSRARSSRAPHGGLESPMPGVVTRVMVQAGDSVKKGQPLLAIEAMKMEHLIRAPRDGRVRTLRARAGDMVNGGVLLVEMEGGDG